MEKLIIVRYGELFLKGNNRKFFENLLVSNIRKSLAEFECTVSKTSGRLLVHILENQVNSAVEKLKKVFGIHSVSVATSVATNIDCIFEECKKLVKKGSFKVETKRADKTFYSSSTEISSIIGGRLMESFDFLTVDVHKPDYVINVDVRENGNTYVFSHYISGSGGMPVGCAGRGVLLLSGGIDSPVAGYLMAKRGMNITAVHFYSYPYTSELAKQKVITLAEKISQYSAGVDLYIVPFTEIQESIHEHCNSEYMITIMRRFMMRIAESIAKKTGAGAIINGESLGQVASQTLESITVTGAVAGMPVFRPLIGFDKIDIIKIAQKIDTYETSILPYEDCCTVFLPKKPVIKPKLHYTETQEQKLDIERLTAEAVEKAELLRL